MVIWPAQSALQAMLKHEHVAIVTAAYLCVYYIGASPAPADREGADLAAQALPSDRPSEGAHAPPPSLADLPAPSGRPSCRADSRARSATRASLRACARPRVSARLTGQVFADPVTFALDNAVGTPARDAVIAAYSDTQRILLIVAVSIASLVVLIWCVPPSPLRSS